MVGCIVGVPDPELGVTVGTDDGTIDGANVGKTDGGAEDGCLVMLKVVMYCFCFVLSANPVFSEEWNAITMLSGLLV